MYVCTVHSSFDIQYNIVVASTLILANLKYNNEWQKIIIVYIIIRIKLTLLQTWFQKQP